MGKGSVQILEMEKDVCEAGLLVDWLRGYGSGVTKGESRKITGNWKSGALMPLKCHVRTSNIRLP